MGLEDEQRVQLARGEGLMAERPYMVAKHRKERRERGGEAEKLKKKRKRLDVILRRKEGQYCYLGCSMWLYTEQYECREAVG